MAARKWILAFFAAAALSLGTGCRSWCERNYPCQQPCPPQYYNGYAPQACPPVPPGAAYPGTPVPAGAYAPPSGQLRCTCVPG